ncbi:MAG: hypothetical protein OZ921_14970 [Sorangiineae bacterium]|nr:hypothetical protein [Polyangiaceae bacterium]MEB2323812.1 hypothetical protein [Sorangiineae bacterium]
MTAPEARAVRASTPTPPTAALATPKPILASEMLREELAPLEPGRSSCRLWQLGAAAALCLLGLALRSGLGLPDEPTGGAMVAFSAAGATATVALLPFPYALRAAMGVLLAGVLVALGLRGAGPLAGLTVDGNLPRSAARLVALTVVPAALMFRAHYRAYRRARLVLAAALALALPFVALEGALLVDADAAFIPRAAAAAAIAAVASGLLGFMGEGTTGLASAWAVLILVALPAELAARELTPLADAATGRLTYLMTAGGVLATGLLASFGLFQLAATALARDARRAAEPLSRPRSEERA